MDIDLMATRERYELFFDGFDYDEIDEETKKRFLQYYKEDGLKHALDSCGVTIRFYKKCAVNLPLIYDCLNSDVNVHSLYEHYFQQYNDLSDFPKIFLEALLDSPFLDLLLSEINKTINHESLHVLFDYSEEEFKNFSKEVEPEQAFGESEFAKSQHLMIRLMLSGDLYAFDTDNNPWEKKSVDETFHKTRFLLTRCSLEKKLEKMF